MTYLGTAQLQNGRVQMPDAFSASPRAASYEAIDLGGDILLVANPLDRKRIAQIEGLAIDSISEHRKSLEGLAK